MTTWTSTNKSASGVAEVDFLFSDGLDFLFSDASDYVFSEGTSTISWTPSTKTSASWTSPVKS